MLLSRGEAKQVENMANRFGVKPIHSVEVQLTSLNLFKSTGEGGASKDLLQRDRKVLEDAIAVENLSGAVFFM